MAMFGSCARFYIYRADPNKAKRQKRQELKRAAEWEKVTGVITGGQAALDKAVRGTQPLPALTASRWSQIHRVPPLLAATDSRTLQALYCVTSVRAWLYCLCVRREGCLFFNFVPENGRGGVNAGLLIGYGNNGVVASAFFWHGSFHAVLLFANDSRVVVFLGTVCP